MWRFTLRRIWAFFRCRCCSSWPPLRLCGEKAGSSGKRPSIGIHLLHRIKRSRSARRSEILGSRCRFMTGRNHFGIPPLLRPPWQNFSSYPSTSLTAVNSASLALLYQETDDATSDLDYGTLHVTPAFHGCILATITNMSYAICTSLSGPRPVRIICCSRYLHRAVHRAQKRRASQQYREAPVAARAGCI